MDFDDVVEWIYELSTQFMLVEGIFDQWSGIPLEQALTKKGLKQMKALQMTKSLNSEIYENFKNMIFDERVRLYNDPVEEGQTYCPYVAELLELQANRQSKYITIVSAPNTEGKHDDRSDALARMVWAASQHLAKPSYFAKGGGVRGVRNPLKKGFASGGRGVGGSHPSRSVPKKGGRR